MKTWLLFVLTGLAAAAHAIYPPPTINPLEVEFKSTFGRTFTQHPLAKQGKTYRAYLEAKKGKRYKLKLTNRTGQRLGVVIAVDGRNIISGKKSWLKSSERMYILKPHASATIKGWRTTNDTVNRFYFTDAGDSYAARVGDDTAIGVVAMAVYRERFHIVPMYQEMAPAPALKKPARKSAPASATSDAGTGYGEQIYSKSKNVEFEPISAPLAKYHYKYAWREVLCEKRLIDCGNGQGGNNNRLWPWGDESASQGGYVPPPPGVE
jgi:hypothetical protein